MASKWASVLQGSVGCKAILRRARRSFRAKVRDVRWYQVAGCGAWFRLPSGPSFQSSEVLDLFAVLEYADPSSSESLDQFFSTVDVLSSDSRSWMIRSAHGDKVPIILPSSSVIGSSYGFFPKSAAKTCTPLKGVLHSSCVLLSLLIFPSSEFSRTFRLLLRAMSCTRLIRRLWYFPIACHQPQSCQSLPRLFVECLPVAWLVESCFSSCNEGAR